ncbi:MAG: hypothetical protein GX196_06050 [Clostridiaceae bacterium]|nr:hypothetical protein [Clostridiaceae bacterium]
MEIIIKQSVKPEGNMLKNYLLVLLGVLIAGFLLVLVKSFPYPHIFQLVIILAAARYIHHIMMSDLVTYDYTLTKQCLYIERSQGVLNPVLEAITLEDILEVKKKSGNTYIRKKYGKSNNMYILVHKGGKFAFSPSEEFLKKLEEQMKNKD